MPITLGPGTLEVIASTPAVLRALTASLPEAIVEARDGDGWSARDIVAHLLDRWPSQRDRVEKMLAEANPVILDEPEVAGLEASGLRHRPLMWLLDEFERTRAAEADAFRGLSASDLARPGQHSVAGPITIAELLNHVAYHDLLHVQQIAATLARVPNAGRGAFGMF
ncbi:MAG: DinB family protein [Chloroflexi bacterium]|nr:DinB family protein [Chloroflexota bacterium]